MNKETLWVKWVHGIYLREVTSIWSHRAPIDSSWYWRKLNAIKEQIHGWYCKGTESSTGSRGVVAGAGMAKQCICSPTIHLGSFRCRHHHADYKWVVPLGNK
ncbi:hypothetical protein H5410_006364 [Solanum commersonii]|uniref:Uncharacterized protein n=1 Tax=Solanum commersonii TaxID=4109 RepID=A0A9J6AA79_SOLCO|nr:hypothetical protein H5410_006364 [Solanum commersonii]